MSRYHHLQPFRDEGRFRNLRQWLNIIFILGSIVGLVWYFTVEKDMGLYIIGGACIFKFVELALRIAKL